MGTLVPTEGLHTWHNHTLLNNLLFPGYRQLPTFVGSLVDNTRALLMRHVVNKAGAPKHRHGVNR